MPGSRRAPVARPVQGDGPPRERNARARENRGERHLGHVEWYKSRPHFVPARRVRLGRRPLALPPGTTVEPGDLVVAELFPDREEAVLVEVFGTDDDPRLDDLAVASRHRLARAFSLAAEQEAERFAPPVLDTGAGRLDLSDRVTFTMDPVDARDFDDALSWRPLDGPDGRVGACEIGIHIADVAHYVREGTALDDEAKERATSVYLAGGAIPMLPHGLSSDLCSLVPGVGRYTMSVLAEMDGRAGVTRYRLAEGYIVSRARLSYESGQAILEGDAAARAAVPPEVIRALTELAAIARRLRDRRMRRGALDLDVPETKAIVDEAGNPVEIVRRERLATMELIEEFMLLANLLVGEEAERRDGPFLFRVHPPPSLSKLAALEAMLAALGLPRFDGTGGVTEALQRLLATQLAPEKRRLLHTLVLRTLARASYSGDDAGHFGLAVRGYCHFTSPIRRYPDLFNHRQVKLWLGLDANRGRLDAGADDVAALALHTSGREQVAQEAERESTRVKALRFMLGRLGEVHEGMITGVVPAGVFVELEDVPVDGFLRVASWIDDDFTMDEAGVRLTGRRTKRRFALGDKVTVRLARIDLPARELELALDRPLAGRRGGGKGAGGKGGKTGGRKAKNPRDPSAGRRGPGGKAKRNDKGRRR
jgi:ribonuclease R